jgi:hypothetical protein
VARRREATGDGAPEEAKESEMILSDRFGADDAQVAVMNRADCRVSLYGLCRLIGMAKWTQ